MRGRDEFYILLMAFVCRVNDEPCACKNKHYFINPFGSLHSPFSHSSNLDSNCPMAFCR